MTYENWIPNAFRISLVIDYGPIGTHFNRKLP